MTPLLSVLLFKYRKDAYKRFFHSRFCRWALKSVFVAYKTAFYPESRNIALNAQVNHTLALRTEQRFIIPNRAASHLMRKSTMRLHCAQNSCITYKD